MYTIEYRSRSDTFYFEPGYKDLTKAKVWFLRYRWWGCKAVLIQEGNRTIWETPDPVIRSIDNPHPTEELPF